MGSWLNSDSCWSLKQPVDEYRERLSDYDIERIVQLKIEQDIEIEKNTG
jgi:hypothetical protein